MCPDRTKERCFLGEVKAWPSAEVKPRNMRKSEAVHSCFFGRYQICCYLELESDG